MEKQSKIEMLVDEIVSEKYQLEELKSKRDKNQLCLKAIKNSKQPKKLWTNIGPLFIKLPVDQIEMTIKHGNKIVKFL